MRILITGAGGPATDALAKGLGDYTLLFADQNPKRIHPSISEEIKFELPTATSEYFESELKTLCIENEVNLIISQVDEELIKVKSVLQEVGNLDDISPEVEFIKLSLDKFNLGKSLRENFVQDPSTEMLLSSSAFGGRELILKPRFGRGSRGVFRVKSESEFDLLKKYLLALGQEYIFQDFLDGQEFTVQMMATKGGQLAAVSPLRVIEKRGSTTNCFVDLNEQVLQTCLAFHGKYLPRGTYNIQLILDKEGYAKIIEINPRVSTTMCVALELGFNPIKIFFQESHEDKIHLPTANIEMRRYWTNFFIRGA